MVRFNITVNPGNTLSDLNRLEQALKTGVKPALQAAAGPALTEMQAKVPVRTGFLRSTLYADVKENSLEVGGKADYTAAVENLCYI